jgi:hypothetical protein
MRRRRISFNTVRHKQPRTKEHLIEAMHRLNHLAEEELACSPLLFSPATAAVYFVGLKRPSPEASTELFVLLIPNKPTIRQGVRVFACVYGNRLSPLRVRIYVNADPVAVAREQVSATHGFVPAVPTSTLWTLLSAAPPDGLGYRMLAPEIK